MPAKKFPKLVKFKSRDKLVRESAVKTLKEALDEAKRGEIVAVAIAVVRPNNAVNTSRSETDDIGRLLGAIDLLHYRTLKATEEDE